MIDINNKNENNITIIKLNDTNFQILNDTTPYNLNIVKKDKSIDIKIKKQLAPNFFEFSFSCEDFLKIDDIFYMYKTVPKIHSMIMKKIKEKDIELVEKDDFMILKLIFKIDSEIQFVSLKVPKNKNEDININAHLEDISTTMLQLIDRVKVLESYVLSENYIKDSTIVKKGQLEMILKWIDAKNYRNFEFKLLYKGSIHGDQSSIFHKLCDNKGPTISFIETTVGRKFGGYTALSWDSSGSFKTNDPTAFLFSLDRNKKFTCISQDYVIYCHSSYNLTFGSGHDICIPNSFGSDPGYCSFPSSYSSLEKLEFNTKTYLSGYYSFMVKDIEIYSVIKK